MKRARLTLSLAGVAFFASGTAALVYQVVWQRVLALHTGVGVESIALIVAAFMAGLGLGNHLGGILSVRLSPPAALMAFAALELAIALFGGFSVPLYYDLLYVRAGALYAAPWAAGLLQFAALVPPTLLMGMSLPFLVRGTVEDAASAGRTIGLLYGINMLGAAAGALLAPWVLIRLFGMPGAVLGAAGANAVAAALAFGVSRARAAPAGDERPPKPAGLPQGSEPAGQHPLALWLGLYAASGFCALSLEILWFRLLDVATHATAFTFGTLLATYLLGSAAGCLVGAVRAPRLVRPLRAFLCYQCLLAAWAGLFLAAFVSLPSATPGIAWLYEYWSSGTIFQLGDAWQPGRLLGLYLVLPFTVFGLPTFLMGLSFPALQRAVQDDPATCGRKVGLLQAANILGCVAGSLAVGLAGLTWLGTSGSLRVVILIGTGFSLVGLFVYGRRSPFPALAALLVVAAVVVPSGDRLWKRLHGADGRSLLLAEDATSVSAIVPAAEGWYVTVNGKRHSRIPFGGIHTRLGAVPAIVHAAPRDVAIVGLGSGDTAWAAACRSQTQRLTVFEIAGRQRALLSRMTMHASAADLRTLLEDPRLTVQVADGRHAIARGQKRYDLIEADALWPNAAYSGNLYSVEFFRECASKLRPGGLMCTWTPTRRVVASFRAAFPHVLAPRDRSLLIGSPDPIAVDPAAWQERVLDPHVVRYLGEQKAGETRRFLERLSLATGSEEDVEPDLDLYPRDEFLTP
jgi:hypothetical protein